MPECVVCKLPQKEDPDQTVRTHSPHSMPAQSPFTMASHQVQPQPCVCRDHPDRGWLPWSSTDGQSCRLLYNSLPGSPKPCVWCLPCSPGLDTAQGHVSPPTRQQTLHGCVELSSVCAAGFLVHIFRCCCEPACSSLLCCTWCIQCNGREVLFYTNL